MQKWFVSMGLALGSAAALTSSVSAQVEIQVQQGQAQDLPAKVQILPVQGGGGIAMADIAIAIRPGGPGFGGGNRLTPVDAIFVGRVVAFEPMDVEVAQGEGQPKVKYRVAVVQVNDAIHGLKKDSKQVRVAFIAPQGNPGREVPGGGIGGGAGGIQIQPAIQPVEVQPFPGPGGRRRPFPGNNQMQLQMGQEGLFHVNKHAKENFYLSPNYGQFVAKENNPNFDAEIKSTKQVAKVLGNPVASLKSEDKQDRYIAAAILINKYRNPNNPTGQAMKQEAIDAAESKLILQALAGGEWKAGVFNAAIPGPDQLFNQLGVGPNDGYNPMNIRTQQDILTAMQKWIDENNGKYRINKMVVDPNAKTGVDVPPDRPIRVRPPIRIQPLPVEPAPVPAPDLPADGRATPAGRPAVLPAPAPEPLRQDLPVRNDR